MIRFCALKVKRISCTRAHVEYMADSVSVMRHPREEGRIYDKIFSYSERLLFKRQAAAYACSQMVNFVIVGE